MAQNTRLKALAIILKSPTFYDNVLSIKMGSISSTTCTISGPFVGSIFNARSPLQPSTLVGKKRKGKSQISHLLLLQA